MSILDHLYMNYDEDDDEEFKNKIKALKEILEDPPNAFWNYEIVQSIIIQYEENGVISDKQVKIIEDAYEQHFD